MSNTKIRLMHTEAKCHENFKVVSNGNQFLIDCGTPENAKALHDAIVEVAFNDDGSPNDEIIGGEVLHLWNVDRYFTAWVEPSAGAVEWCKEFLSRKSSGSA